MGFMTKWRREEGSIALIAAVAFALTVALCGLVVDMGTAYKQGSVSQNTADAAAYAAGTLLPVSVGDAAAIETVQNMVAEYVVKNGMEPEDIISVELEDAVGGKYMSVRVKLQTQVSYFFGPILGIDGSTVTKSAKVRMEAVTSSSKVVPLGIVVNQYNQAIDSNQTQNIIIKYGSSGGSTGFFGALDLDGVQGGGAKDFATWLAFGYDGILRAGEILPVESGNMSGPTNSAFLTRYSQCTHYASQGGCNTEYFNPDCPRVVYLIIYSMVGTKDVKIEGFSPFILEGINSQGEIIASHITINTDQGESQAITEDTADYGIRRIRLVE